MASLALHGTDKESWSLYHAWLKGDVRRWYAYTTQHTKWTEAELYIGQCACCRTTVAVPLADAIAMGVL